MVAVSNTLAQENDRTTMTALAQPVKMKHRNRLSLTGMSEARHTLDLPLLINRVLCCAALGAAAQLPDQEQYAQSDQVEGGHSPTDH